ncbi:MAG TPA: chemotaxis protein CheW [Candidatus Acidoferrales bacterium]|nr:chemotaxis protein CheW [Candidatus Acidoferrales bacterium]
MGVIADAVSHLMDISAEEIQAVPAFGTRIKVDYLLGMAQLGKKFALVLDMNKLLSTDELLDLSAVQTGAIRNSAPKSQCKILSCH